YGTFLCAALVWLNPIKLHANSPNDPQYPSQWNLRKVGATNAWELASGEGVVVAIIDTGVNYLHEDLRENMWRNPGETGFDSQGRDKSTNGIDDDGNGYVDDVFGIDAAGDDSDPMDEGGGEPRVYHGTFIAGVIAGTRNNGKGITGLAPGAKIMALRASSVTDVWTASDIVKCYRYVIDMKRRGVNVRVVNNSYGGDYAGEAVGQAMEEAGNEGIVVVCSAGNSGMDLDLNSRWPQNFKLRNGLVVGAANESDQFLLNYGRTIVDLAAPATNIRSTYAPGMAAYQIWTDATTSFATPHVTATVALLASFDPSLSVDELKAAILGSVDVFPSMRGRSMTAGRLNAARALATLGSTRAPIVIHTSPSVLREPGTQLSVTFSTAMNKASVEQAWQLNPAAAGYFTWSNGDRTVAFSARDGFQSLTNYTVTLRGSATDQSGASLDGNYNRASEGAGLDDLQWSFRHPPQNDDVFMAELIQGRSGEHSGTNRNASKEGRELDKAGSAGGASVWYRWVAMETGPVIFETAGTDFDTLLVAGVREANHLDQDIIRAVPAWIAQNDNDGALKTSRISFVATNGVSYVIGVDGKTRSGTIPTAQTGEFSLRWYPAPQRIDSRRLAGGQVELSWPATAVAYKLESTDQLAEGAKWSEVTEVAIVSGGKRILTQRLDGSRKFFRLRMP
ncbi:MAG: in-like serine protease-like protein, partial [Verrucomicrobiales bacterium]|nr:in-like serine protease-like protein [Verrucomicrobiales bacterium]